MIINNDVSIAFEIGTMPVTWYGIFVGIGLVLSWLFMYMEWTRVGGSKKVFSWLTGIAIFSGIVGARWFYLILNPTDIYGAIAFFDFGSGRSIMGGIMGAAIGIVWFIWYYKISVDYRMIMSIVLPNVLLGQAIGRWGNFTNQEIYGQVVDNLDWLPTWMSDIMYIDNEYRQPLFLYEFIINLIGWILIAFILKQVKWFKPGTHGAMYLMWYGTTRASMELMRDPDFIMHIGPIPTSFVLAIIWIVVGIGMFIYLQFYYWQYQEYKTCVLVNKKKYKKEKMVVRFNYALKKITKEQKVNLMASINKEQNKAIKNAYQENKLVFEKFKQEDGYYFKTWNEKNLGDE